MTYPGCVTAKCVDPGGSVTVWVPGPPVAPTARDQLTVTWTGLGPLVGRLTSPLIVTGLPMSTGDGLATTFVTVGAWVRTTIGWVYWDTTWPSRSSSRAVNV